MLLLAVALVATAGVGLDRGLGTPEAVGDARVEVVDASAGAWYCAIAGGADDAGASLTVAAPPSDGTEPAAVAIDPFHEGDGVGDDSVQVFAGGMVTRAIAGAGEQVGVAARWWGAPAAVARTWRVPGTIGPAGLVEGPCEPGPSTRWYVPGVATAGGAQARLVLVNPFTTDATLRVSFTGPDGRIEPKRLENVVVPERSVREILLNEHAPEQPDLGVVVEARSGRVVAEALQTFSAAIGGIDGATLVAATARPAETWTIPWFEDAASAAAVPEEGGTPTEGATEGPDADEQPPASGARSWLWVSNPSSRPAALVVTLHTNGGGHVPEGLEELTLEPGETQRVDLRGQLPPGAPHGGVTIRSDNGVPFVASVATEYADPATERTGVAIQLGAAEPDRRWVLAGAAGPGRRRFVHVANPGGDEAVVDLAVQDGSGLVRPEELQGLTIAPAAIATIDLGAFVAPEATGVAVFVEARAGSVVASTHAFAPEGRRDAVAARGVPQGTWRSRARVPAVGYAPTLPERIGTSLGPSPRAPVPGVPTPDPLASPEPASSPLPGTGTDGG